MTLSEKLTRQFYRWEERGRGWRVFDRPVTPEPPFLPFRGHYLPDPQALDDGQKHTLFSSLIQKVSRNLNGNAPKSDDDTLDEVGPEPRTLIRDALVELAITLPTNHPAPRDAFEQFLSNLSTCREPIAFELIGTHEAITPQFAVHPSDALHFRQLFAAYVPEAVLLQRERMLETLWGNAGEPAIVEFGLAHEFMLPLKTGNMDAFIGLTSALAELAPDETALFQVIFEPVQHPWSESVLRAVTDGDGAPFFVNHPELDAGAKLKVARPLYAAVVRMAAQSPDYSRAWEIVRSMSSALIGFANPQGNELIPLHNDGYPLPAHAEDVFRRQSHRSGMLLNSEELLGFVHLPSAAVKSPKLIREKGESKAAPSIVQHEGVLLGHNLHTGQMLEVRLSPDQRVRHAHIIGASGTGKSTLLFNLIRQDIENSEGLAVLDPHGDLIEHILGIIPPHRIADIVLLDPSDEEYSIGFNILSAHSELEKTLLASDLSSVFKRLSSSWGDQMHSVLSNAILAFLESSQGGTLADMRRFLLDTGFRERFLQTVSDPEVVYYWRKSFPQLGGNKSIGPLLTRLETFLGPKPIRYMVSQKENRLDFGDIMDGGKIFLAKLSHGQIGRENSYLLGSLLMSKFQQEAMSRQSMGQSERRPFWLYVDEFPHFISPSIADILTGARKYNVGLILAHQELRQLQLDADVAGAVLSNAGTRVVFRVGDADAKDLAEGFTGFKADSLRKLGTGEAICRVERSDFDFNLTVPLDGSGPDVRQPTATREQVIASSRATYGRLRSDIQAEEMRQFQTIVETEIKPRSPDKLRKLEQPIPTPEVSSPVVLVPPPVPAVIVTASKPVVSTHVPPPADMGRGGAQHQTIQHRLKAVAEELGFKATIEKQVLDGQGSVDLALEKEGFAIACEITVTTTIDHEFGNVHKCIRAGFPLVAVISPKAERLERIEEAVKAGLDSEESDRVRYFLPEECITWLHELAPAITPQPASPPVPSVRTTRGYKVRRSAAKLTEEERKAKEDIALKAIAASMKRPRRQP